MEIFNYDRITGAFMGRQMAERDPMTPDHFLIPAFATHIEPPQVADGHVPIFVNGKWEAQPLTPPAAPPTPAVLDPVTRTAAYQQQVTVMADLVAVQYGFDNIAEAVGYADEPAVPRFQLLGRALRAWRSVLWDAFDNLIARIDRGEVDPPVNPGDLYALLPGFDPNPPQEPSEG